MEWIKYKRYPDIKREVLESLPPEVINYIDEAQDCYKHILEEHLLLMKAYKKIEKKQDGMEWINFEETLPPKNKYVLFYVPKGAEKDSYIFYAYYTDGNEGDSYWGSVWFDNEESKYRHHDVTHWMQLPPAPK